MPEACERASNTRAMATAAAFSEPVEISDLALDGAELLGLGVAPGPAVGRALTQLLEYVLEDPTRNTAGVLSEYVRANVTAFS